MPRYPFRADLAAQCRAEAGLTDDYVTEMSYQTENNHMWLIITKSGKTLEHATKPDLTRLVKQVADILRAGKTKLYNDRQLSDYLDTSVVLPDKPLPTPPQAPTPGPSRPGQS